MKFCILFLKKFPLTTQYILKEYFAGTSNKDGINIYLHVLSPNQRFAIYYFIKFSQYLPLSSFCLSVKDTIYFPLKNGRGRNKYLNLSEIIPGSYKTWSAFATIFLRPFQLFIKCENYIIGQPAQQRL